MRQAILLSACLAAACSGSGSSASERRTFGVSAGFNGVALSGPDNVVVVQGATPSVVAEGPGKVLDRLEVVVEGGTLKVRRKSGFGNWHWGEREVAHITVTAPAISSGHLAGSGDLTLDRVAGDRVELDVTGSGDLKASRVEGRSVRLGVTGSGDLTAVGRAGSIAASLAGSGNIVARALQGEQADVSLAGSGDVDVHATRTATVNLAGSGDVTVTGTDDCRISKRGSGEVRCSR